MTVRSSSNDLGPIAVAIRLASSDFVAETRRRLQSANVVRAVAYHDIPTIFSWMMSLLPLQGISDNSAMSFQDRHGKVSWAEVSDGLFERGGCPRLRSWWHFRCGYQKSTWTCAEPDHIGLCGLPEHDLRKGTLNQAAYGLRLFIRDICNDDLVAWLDSRLANADVAPDPAERGRSLCSAVVQPLSEVPGTGPKLWNMILADLLIAGDPGRERWVAAGASMIAVDTLVHAWLHRTGTLQRYGAAHPYGPKCYGPGGCADVIDEIAKTVDARAFNPSFPAFFPRFIQVAIWEFCAEGGRNLCNGRQIDDRQRCQQVLCPARDGCERIALHRA